MIRNGWWLRNNFQVVFQGWKILFVFITKTWPKNRCFDAGIKMVSILYITKYLVFFQKFFLFFPTLWASSIAEFILLKNKIWMRQRSKICALAICDRAKINKKVCLFKKFDCQKCIWKCQKRDYSVKSEAHTKKLMQKWN